MAERVSPGQTRQLRHFVSTSPWSTARLEQVLRKTADALVGGEDAVLIVADTALPNQGKHSVGVKRHHCGVLGKHANCQGLVSLTLAQKGCQYRCRLWQFGRLSCQGYAARATLGSGYAAYTLECEARSSGERKYYFTNHPPNTPRRTLVRAIKARWACGQTHQQLKDEHGLDHYEGRSWLGLHHHALLTMIAFGYLQHRRLASAFQAGEKTDAQYTE